MKYINLYDIYLHNVLSIIPKANKIAWLEEEKNRISNIISRIQCVSNSLEKIKLSKDKDIYQLIEAEIFCQIFESKIKEETVFINTFLLQGLVNEITNLQQIA